VVSQCSHTIGSWGCRKSAIFLSIDKELFKFLSRKSYTTVSVDLVSHTVVLLFDYLTHNSKTLSKYCTGYFQATSKLRRRNLKTEVWLWKRIKCFPYTLCYRKITTSYMYILDFCSKKNTSRRSRNYRFRKAPLLKCFLLTTFSNSTCLKSVFQKASFSWRISVNGRSYRRNRAVISNFYGVAWTPPQLHHKAYAIWYRRFPCFIFSQT